MMKKILLITSTFLLSFLVFLFFWANTVTPLSAETQAVIQQVVTQPLPERIAGESGFAHSSGVKIWYEVKPAKVAQGQVAKDSILLINGLGASGIFWPEEIVQGFSSAGYSVIIPDHRSSGLSDWGEGGYDLTDLLNDNIAVLDHLKINKVHILGLSLGGMIGQEMALQYPERVLSLTSAMSSGFTHDPEFPVSPTFELDALKLFVRYGIFSSEENTIKMMVGIYNLLKAEAAIDVDHIARTTLYELRQRRGFNHKLAEQQADAIYQSGSRLSRLSALKVPTLVVHGDSDPLVNIAAAKKYAALIPNAQTLWVPGMGHALAPSTINLWMNRAIKLMNDNHG